MIDASTRNERYFFLPGGGADGAVGFFWFAAFFALSCAFFFWLFFGFASPIPQRLSQVFRNAR
jgi:hypothetical protein